VNVQLMNEYDNVEGVQTTNDGTVYFSTFLGFHRLHVSSESYADYNGSFDVFDRRQTEIVYLYPKPVPGAGPPPAGSGMTDARRLKIPPAAQKEYDRGVAASEQQQWPQARQHFRNAIALYPDYDRAYNGLGVAAFNSNDLKAARAAFDRALGINDRYAAANRNLARILLSEKKYEQAERLLARSLTAEPMNAWALTWIAYAELQSRNYAAAVQNARQAHRLPHEGLAYVHMIAGSALEALRQQPAAADEYQLYLEEAPSGEFAEQAREALARLKAFIRP
jgi:tetratricopeptide (TPR) repeat protein